MTISAMGTSWLMTRVASIPLMPGIRTSMSTTSGTNWARRGPPGRRDGFVAAAFHHRQSRDGDPQMRHVDGVATDRVVGEGGEAGIRQPSRDGGDPRPWSAGGAGAAGRGVGLGEVAAEQPARRRVGGLRVGGTVP